MNRDELQAILPHRDSMLLLDEAVCDGDTAKGLLHIRGDEWFLDGHFPGNPVVPGVVLCEIMAQSVCVLLSGVLEAGSGKLPLFTGLDKVKFRHSVRPGDSFRTECTLARSKPPFYFAVGRGFVGDTLCAEAHFSFAITDAAKDG